MPHFAWLSRLDGSRLDGTSFVSTLCRDEIEYCKFKIIFVSVSRIRVCTVTSFYLCVVLCCPWRPFLSHMKNAGAGPCSLIFVSPVSFNRHETRVSECCNSPFNCFYCLSGSVPECLNAFTIINLVLISLSLWVLFVTMWLECYQACRKNNLSRDMNRRHPVLWAWTSAVIDLKS